MLPFPNPRLIVFTGPESTGKTTLSHCLAEERGWLWVSEYARTYLSALDRPYDSNDLLEIARGQKEAIERALDVAKSEGRPAVIADTDLLTLYVWSKVKYGSVSPAIRQMCMIGLPDLYLLMAPDIPWEEDSLRESPKSRESLYSYYLDLIEATGTPCVSICGEGEERRANALQAIDEFLNRN